MYNRIIFWRAAGCFKSALAILEAMEGRVSDRSIVIRKLENSKIVAKPTDFIINWGNGGYKTWKEIPDDCEIFNAPWSVELACNKVKTFRALNDNNVRTLDWTTHFEMANDWWLEGHVVIGRKIIDGCCGEGIEIYNPKETIPVQKCPLYTKYKKKRHEYRVHVVAGKVIDIVQKKKKKGSNSPTNGMIRNVDDGWVFCHNNLEIKDVDRLSNIGIRAVKACGLDFGAVDVIWNESEDKYYVVEVNTAPGLESSTIKKYADAFLEIINANN